MASSALTGRREGASRKAELLLILIFWSLAFLIGSIRGIAAGEIPFPLIAPHRLAVMALGGLLCWAMIFVLDAVRSRSFLEQASFGLVGAGAMALLQSIFQMASCRVAPIEGYPPMNVREAISFGMISLGYFVAWTWMHFALVAQQKRGEAGQRPTAKESSAHEPVPSTGEKTFWVSRGRQLTRVSAADLLWAEAQRDYVMLHGSGGAGGMLRKTLSGVQADLDPSLFVRVHRSALVRQSAIEGIRRKPSGALAVTLSNGAEVPVGRSYASGIRALLAEVRQAG